MLRMLMDYCRYYVNDESGQGMVEYALILVLVSIVAIAMLTLVGTNVTTVFTNIKDALVKP